MLKRLSILAAFFAGAVMFLGLCYQPAHATLTWIKRYNQYFTTLPDPNTFANAQLSANILNTLSGNVGDTFDEKWSLDDATSANVSGDSNMAISNFVFTPYPGALGTNQATATFTVTASTGAQGQTDLHFIAPLSVSILLGHYALDESFTSPGGVALDDPYIWRMTISGDWSVSGTNTGDHQLVTYNSAYWTICKDFVFDGTNTTFSAYATNGYNSAENINLEFILYGGVVPLPPSMLLLGSGLLGLAGWIWFRKS